MNVLSNVVPAEFSDGLDRGCEREVSEWLFICLSDRKDQGVR